MYHFLVLLSIVSGHSQSLDQFSYSDRDIADITTSCTRNVSFLGITGQVKFDITGEPLKNVKVDQIQGLYVFLSCVCYAFVHVCLYVPCGHLLGKG